MTNLQEKLQACTLWSGNFKVNFTVSASEDASDLTEVRLYDDEGHEYDRFDVHMLEAKGPQEWYLLTSYVEGDYTFVHPYFKFHVAESYQIARDDARYANDYA